MPAESFRRSSLTGRERDLARIGAAEVPFTTQLSIRSRTPETLGLPTETNTWTELAGSFPREALWLGPDEWLVVGPPNTGTSFHRIARADLGFEDPAAEGIETADALVDVSASRTVIELARDDHHDPRDLLEQGCGLDLHPRSWREGMCAQTLLARIPVILQEREASTRIFVRPSVANYLVDWFVHVADVRT